MLVGEECESFEGVQDVDLENGKVVSSKMTCLETISLL